MDNNTNDAKALLFADIRQDTEGFLGFQEYPEFGKWVRSGSIQGQPYDFDHALGYVVQIRKKRGQFGSDQYLIRNASGSLAVHENQSFYLVDDELAEQAMSHFAMKPDQEGENTEYTIGHDHGEVGYIIESKDGDPKSPSPAFAITITTTK